MLSAREREAQKIVGTRSRGGDYVNKPFQVGELMARMRAAVRHRMQRMAETSALRVGDLEIDPVRHRMIQAGSR